MLLHQPKIMLKGKRDAPFPHIACSLFVAAAGLALPVETCDILHGQQERIEGRYELTKCLLVSFNFTI